MTFKSPPQWPLKFLRFFVNSQRIDEIEGDLFELYQEKINISTPLKANLFYWSMVIRSFRHFAIKNSKSMLIRHLLSSVDLFSHHSKITFRQLWRQRTTTLINIVGLSVGLAGFIGVFYYIKYETSFNKHIPGNDRIYRLFTRFEGEFTGYNRGVPTGASEYLSINLPNEVAFVTRFHTLRFNASPITTTPTDALENEVFTGVPVVIVDTSYFHVFGQYNWLVGSPDQSLTKPNQVVLTQSQAKKYFGNLPLQDFLGKKIVYRDSLNTTVSGIIEQLPGNSDFIFSDFISFPTIKSTWLAARYGTNSWVDVSSSSQTWIKCFFPIANKIGYSEIVKEVNKQIQEENKDEYFTMSLDLKNLQEIHFDQEISIFDNRGRGAISVNLLYTLGSISLVILLMAIFNFINLSTGQALSHTKEAGIRKVLGSHRSQLIQKSLLESFYTSLFASLLALPMVFYAYVYLKEFLPGDMPLQIIQVDVLQIVIISLLAVSLLSGIYPALLFAKMKPTEVFRSKINQESIGRSTKWFRSGIMVFQFSCAQLLIITAMIVLTQTQFLKNKNLGFISDDRIYLNTPYDKGIEKTRILKEEIEKIPGVEQTILQSDAPASNNYSSSIFTYTADNQIIKEDAYIKNSDHSYIEFYQIPMLSLSSKDWSLEKRNVLINDTFRKKLGFTSPDAAVGSLLTYGDTTNLIIAGVMSDFHTSSMKSPVPPMVLLNNQDTYGIAIAVSPSSTQEVVSKISDLYLEIFKTNLNHLYYLDETLRSFYEEEQRMSQLAGITTFIAILIAALGLYGLISLTLTQRTKEVGVRKVLGASELKIGWLIAYPFLMLVLIAMLIAIPIAYWWSEDWLSNYAYRIPLNIWLYLSGVSLSILVAIFSIFSKVYYITRRNPIESLRYE